VAGRLGLAGGRLRLHQPGTARAAGRFSLLAAPPLAEGPLRADERSEAWARILLARWGVVSRAVVEREAAVRWADVSPVLARLEMRGDLRRGEFVAGGGPIQYADEETVETLRHLREEPSEALTAACGADPVLFDVSPPPARDDLLVLRGGVEIVRLEQKGALTLAPELPDTMLRASLAALCEMKRKSREPLGRPRRLTVGSVNGRPVAGSAVAPLLELHGFVRSAGVYAFRAL
jgi:ATP-dependent Lhr-like helicase